MEYWRLRMSDRRDPHGHQAALRVGPDVAHARLAVVSVHGRGASAEDILGLAAELRLPDVLFVAPQAAGRTWYPFSFLAPMTDNEPGLSSGLARIGTLIDELAGEGLPPERIGLLGFSQGACLALEFTASHARRYAGIAGLSGGLIGPPGTPRAYSGTLETTPVFLGCSNVDTHIPLERVHETARVFRALGAAVDQRIYPDMDHSVNRDEIDAVRALFGGERS